MNVSRLNADTPPAAPSVCPPGTRQTDVVFPGAGDRIVSCSNPRGETQYVLDTPDPRDAPPLQRGLATVALGAIAAPALGAFAGEGGLAALASFSVKALSGVKASVTQPEEIGKLVGGGIAFEVLKGALERLAPALFAHREAAPEGARGAPAQTAAERAHSSNVVVP